MGNPQRKQVDEGLEAPGPEVASGLTSIELRRALTHDTEAWAHVIERLSPLLELQAHHRLRGDLARLYDPQDLVNDVWVVAIARLGELDPRDGRLTPVVVRFLASTLLNRVNELLRKHLGREPSPPAETERWRLAELSRAISPVSRRAARSETAQQIREQLARLEPEEREVLVLRGLEGLANLSVARKLGQKESTVAMRYKRALEKLRRQLPESLCLALEGA